MNQREVVLAGVAVAFLTKGRPRRVVSGRAYRSALLRGWWRKDIGRRKHRLAAQLADARGRARLLVSTDTLHLAKPGDGLDQPPPLSLIRSEHRAGCHQQPFPVVGAEGGQQPAIVHDGLERLDGLLQTFQQRRVDDFFDLRLHLRTRYASLTKNPSAVRRRASVPNRSGFRSWLAPYPRNMTVPGVGSNETSQSVRSPLNASSARRSDRYSAITRKNSDRRG